jgi:hypothetical protein
MIFMDSLQVGVWMPTEESLRTEVTAQRGDFPNPGAVHFACDASNPHTL